ncbi:titin isoform X2 [Drosophila hydei]|uniref:Titin isoform X2 n=1 Tax=Drosophila hydei TaxID=7224 RepID=A0A6J1M0M8_DROHY|nr:titin isoform X2 [Drosophila hydei]
MVVCALQSYTADQQSNGCSAMKSAEATQVPEPEILDNGNGAEEDREEGEIVDEFEMIISSEDEEFKLRARIQQLEDKSKDIEKMDMLSANLANQYNYQRPQVIERFSQYQHFSPISVLSDVSSLSEEEYELPKKYRKHKMKRSESRRHGQMYRRNPFANRTHAQHVRRKRRHEHHNNQYCQQSQTQSQPQSQSQSQSQSQTQAHHNQPSTILLDSLDSVTEDEICEYDMNVETENDDNEDRLKVSRNKLRVALARDGNCDIKPKHSLRERLQYRMHKSPSPSRNQVDSQLKAQDQLPPNSFDGYSQHRNVREEEEEEQQQQSQQQEPLEEPPELKLRLIALKSAILKKHMARKKRDAERAYSPTDMINRVHQPTTNNECDDIDDLMEISPAASPERNTYSPPQSRFAEPVDMELAQTDSDEDRQQWNHNWQSTIDSAGGSWRCFMPSPLPPVAMPIVIDDDDEEELQPVLAKQKQFDDEDDGGPQPPPSFHIPHMQLEDDDARDALHLSERHSQQGCLSDIQSISMDNSQTQTQTSRPFQQESSDDEAGALRAMLLSKLKPAEDPMIVPNKLHLPAAVANEGVAHDSDDPEELRQLLLSSIASKKKQTTRTTESPEILKNAVRRFQTSSLQSSPDESQTDVPFEPAPQTDANLQPVAVCPQSKQEPSPMSLPLPSPLPVPSPLPAPAPAPKEPEPTPQGTVEVATVQTPIKSIPSTIPSTSIIKIVKPNKVINKKTAPKRKLSKLVEQATAPKRPSTLLVKESVAPLHSKNSSSTTRLITTLDPASIKVNRLVIALADSSAGSDDELELRSCYAYSSYASPFSQAMDSASSSTTRSNTPNSEIVESAASSNSNLRRTVINEYFEKKLDDFLKQARSKVPTALPTESSAKATTKTEKSSEQTNKIAEQTPVIPQKAKPTPVAVRHLPVASQREYLRLIERMQLLEKKKIGVVKAANGQATGVAVAKESSNDVRDNISVAATTKPGTTTPSKPLKKATVSAPAAMASDLPSTSTAAAVKAAQPSKESRLKAFESSFQKIGGSMIANLDKSLHMVAEAKRSKIERLRHSQRLKDLFAEVQAVKLAVKQEESKLARIQPEIQASHEIIISLKQKRNKLRNAAMDLGNGLLGADYRLLDPAKAEITRKSMELTKEIRLYNSIVKYDDVRKGEAQAQPSSESSVAQLASVTSQKNPCEQPPLSVNSQPRTELEEQKTDAESEAQAQPALAAPDEPAGEATTTLATQLDFDIAPGGVAPDPIEGRNAPPHVVSFMRQLHEPPVKPSLLSEYRTPMSRNYNSQLNVNATICPFELMGRCEDADCSYLHLARASPPAATVAAALKQ